VLHPTLFSEETIESLREQYVESVPYNHVVIKELCTDNVMRDVHEEAKNNLKANFKETDLFKVFQSGELALIDNDGLLSKQMPSLLAMRNAIYSESFRNLVSKVTGCNDLIERVDCSANAYANSCHLLCHDDVIGTRRVSYVIYLTDPDEPWTDSDGGALELYPILPSTTASEDIATPSAMPSARVLPLFNSMILFAVRPGLSFHSVQEVFTTKPRLSISGWYHGPSPLADASKSSLRQIMSTSSTANNTSEDVTNTPFYRLNHTASSSKSDDKPAVEEFLNPSDVTFLKQFINPLYLKPSYMEDVNLQFCENSSLQLDDFLRADLASAISHSSIEADALQNVGGRKPQLDYTVGLSHFNQSTGWKLVGPPHKQRYLRYEDESSQPLIPPINTQNTEKIETSSANDTAEAVGEQLNKILKELFGSAVFAKYLQIITSLEPLGVRGEVRRFRAGLDYTVAHYGILTVVPRLDATLCFVSEDNELQATVLQKLSGSNSKKKKAKPAKKSSKKAKKESLKAGKKNRSGDADEEIEEGEQDDDDLGVLWDSGEVGGFECFIEVDENEDGADNNMEAAEVYGAGQGKKNKDGEEEEEDSKLLSVSAGSNVLSLVLRDQGIMKFVKYVSANAPGSRWDVAVEYEIAPIDSSDEKEGEEEDDDDDDDDDGSDAQHD